MAETERRDVEEQLPSEPAGRRKPLALRIRRVLPEARRRHTSRVVTMINRHTLNLKPDPNSFLPVQFFADPKKASEPVQRLMLAVLLDAMRCYQSNFGSASVRGRIEFHEARQWLFDRCSEAPFSLNSVCSVLGIEPCTVQRTVSDWARVKRAGFVTARLPRRTPVKVKEQFIDRMAGRHMRMKRHDSSAA